MNYSLEEHKSKKKIQKGESAELLHESAKVVAKVDPNSIKDLHESAEGKKKRRLVVKMEAIHTGRTANYTYYTEEGLKNGLSSWTTPYHKPVLTHHNQLEGEPIGRILEAEYSDTNLSGKSGLVFTVEVTDPDAIEKVLDGRYQTVSIGASTDKVTCNICGTDRTEDWCEHWKGESYDGQECHYIIGTTYGKEVSYVNTPSDQHAGNVSVKIDDGNEGSQEESAAIRILQVAEGLVQDISQPGVNLYESSDTLKGMVDELVKEGSDSSMDEKTIDLKEYEAIKESFEDLQESHKELKSKHAQVETDLAEAQATVTKMYVKNEKLEGKIEEMKSENESVVAENTSLRESLHKARVEKIVEMKQHLKKKDVIGVSKDEAIEAHIKKSSDYLTDLEKDLEEEMKDSTFVRGQVTDPTSKSTKEDEEVSKYTMKDAESIIRSMFNSK